MNNKEIILVHGYNASPDLYWLPLIKEFFEAQGYKVTAPAFPHPTQPKLDEWLSTIRKQVTNPSETILVGYSLGGGTTLRYLEQAEVTERFAGVVLVSTNVFDVGYEILNEWFATEFSFDEIKKKSKQFVTVLAMDDPVLAPDPLKHGRIQVEKLGAKMIVLPEGGHFGTQKLDDVSDVVDAIMKMVKK